MNPGWIKRQLDRAEADADEWPEWYRRAKGLPPGETKAQLKERIAALRAALESASYVLGDSVQRASCDPEILGNLDRASRECIAALEADAAREKENTDAN